MPPEEAMERSDHLKFEEEEGKVVARIQKLTEPSRKNLSQKYARKVQTRVRHRRKKKNLSFRGSKDKKKS